ncbi:MAG: response regulator [Polyangiales bacterium]
MARNSDRPAAGATIRALVATDDPFDLETLGAALHEAGYEQAEVVHARTLAAAVERLREGRFDVVVADLQLPDESGLECVSELTAAAPDTPVVVLTNLGDDDLARAALRLGAEDYIERPRATVGTVRRALRHALERHRSRAELKRALEAEARMRADARRVIDRAQDGMGIYRDGVWVYANDTLARQLGAESTAALVGVEVLSSVHPADRPSAARRMRETRASRPPEPGVVRFLKGEGAWVALEVSTTPLEGFEGEGACLVVTRDLTERRRLFGQFIAADRSAAMGTLAASIAHGINTPMTQVVAGAALARDDARRLLEGLDATAGREDLDRVRAALRELADALKWLHEGADNAARLARGLGMFSLQSEAEGRPVDLEKTLAAVVALTGNSIRHRARFVTDVGPLPKVVGSEARVGHLLLSALVRAAQAVPEGDADRHEIALRASRVGDAVLIEVNDSGEPDDHEGLVDPSDPMTALERGAAPRSLALAICRSIAEELGGAFEVTPSWRGTRVAIRLLAAEQREWVPPLSSRPASEAPRGRVLIVDDEKLLVELMARILHADHEVVGTSDPTEALARIEAGERFDAIVCDLMMPKMSGIDLHAAVARFAPHVAARMLFLTAGAFTARARDFLASGAVPWFEKPIEPERLRQVVTARVARSLAEG